MINTRLEINGKSYAVVTDIPVSANYRIADIREPDKRNASLTKTISIYANSEINKLFENIFEVNIDLQTFNPNLKSDAVYFVDELENFKGDLQLLKIVKKPDNNIIYECNIIGQGGSLFLDIGDKLITGNTDSADDLDFSAYNHTYTRANQIASYSNRGSSYIYPFIHKGSNNGGDNTFSVKDFLPCFFVKEYLQKIIAKTGRTYTSNFINSSEFENHIIYPNIDTIELSQTQLDNSQFYAGMNANVTAIQNSNSEQIIFNKETAPFFDVGNQNNTTTGIVTLNDNGKYNFACVLKLRVQVTHTDPSVTYAISTLDTIQPRVIINRSVDGGATYTSVAVTQNNWANNPANTFNVNTWYNDTIACATGDMYFYTGDKFKADYFIQSGNIKYYNASNVEVTTGTGTVTIEIVSGNTGSAFYALRSDKQVAEGNAMAVNNALPKNIKQKDLFKSIIQMFNLYVDIDKNDVNNLIIEPFDDFYDGIVDWENKTDLDKDRTTTPIALIEGKKYIYRYKEDGDFFNKKYKDKWLEPFGTQNVTIENDFLKQDKVNEIIFSPTPNVANYDLGIIHPKIYKKEGGVISTFTPNIRILTVGGTFQADNAWTYQQAGLSDITTYDYLYAGHTDHPLTPTFDLNFGLPKEVYYNIIGSYFIDNNLFNRFHKNYLNNIINKNSKIETKYLWLSPKDIYEFDFRKKYFIDGAYYIVNQIIDYNPMRQDSTQVELVKLLEPEPFTPTSYLISSVPSVSSGVDVEVETPNSSLRLGTNTINQGENCVAIGNNIIIPKGCSNVTVIGDNVVVEENVSNFTGINISDVSIDETYSGKTLTSGFSPNDGVKFIYTKSDFPEAISGVITLEDNVTYFISTTVDLTGDRLVCGQNTTIIGGSSENCRLKSTGLTTSPLISSDYSLPMRNITIEADLALKLTGDINTTALDWFGVNFTDCVEVGDITDYANVILTDCAFLNSGVIKFDGTIGTIGINSTLFNARGSSTCIKLESTLTITRRFRIIYSSFIVLSGETGIDADLSAVIPTESYILDTVNFSGGGTYLSGLDHTSNDSLFINCVGITNTAVNGQLYMQGNATATTISATNTFYKVAGTTTASADNSKFSHSNNRLTCDAVISRKYLIQCILSFTSGNNNVCEFGFYDSQLAAVRTPSRTKSTANASGRAENVSFACVVTMKSGDYLEIYCANTSASTNITVDNMNFIITEIK